MPLHFYERPTLVPIFTNWKKCKEDFHVYEKWWKAKIAVRVGFAARGAWTEAVRTWPASGAPSAFRGNYTQRLCLEPRALNCAGATGLHLHLLGASVSKVRPKYQKSPREVLLGGGGLGTLQNFPGRWIVTALLWAILAQDKFHRHAVLWTAGKAVCQRCFLVLSWGFLSPAPLAVLAYSKPMNQLPVSVSCFLVAANYWF